MRKLFIALFLFTTFSLYANENLKGTTWTYTGSCIYKNIPHEVTCNFVFLTETEVMWLVETHTKQYIFPIAIGTYDYHSQTITFSKRRNGHQKYWYGHDIEVYLNPNKQVMQFHLSADAPSGLTYYLSNNGVPVHVQQTNTPSINNNLAYTSWYSQDSETKTIIEFTSPSEITIKSTSPSDTDIKHCSYVSIGNKIGFVSGDNIDDEVIVGVWQDNVMVLHREGCIRSKPVSIILTKN